MSARPERAIAWYAAAKAHSSSLSWRSRAVTRSRSARITSPKTSWVSAARSSSPISCSASYVIFLTQQEYLFAFHDLADEGVLCFFPLPIFLLVERQIVDLALHLLFKAHHHVVQFRDVHLADHHKVDVAV